MDGLPLLTVSVYAAKTEHALSDVCTAFRKVSSKNDIVVLHFVVLYTHKSYTLYEKTFHCYNI